MLVDCEVCGEPLHPNVIHCSHCSWYVRRNGTILLSRSPKDLDRERTAWAKDRHEKLERLEKLLKNKHSLLVMSQQSSQSFEAEKEQHQQEIATLKAKYQEYIAALERKIALQQKQLETPTTESLPEIEALRTQIETLNNKVALQQELIKRLREDKPSDESRSALSEELLTQKISQALSDYHNSIEQKLDSILTRLDDAAKPSSPMNESPQAQSDIHPPAIFLAEHVIEPDHQLLSELVYEEAEPISYLEQLEPLENPLSPEEQHVVDAYHSAVLNEDHYRPIDETQDSIEGRLAGRKSSPSFEETRRSRYYWLVQGVDQQYLVPKSDLNLNEFALRSLKSLFQCQGDLITPNSFQLIKPGHLEQTLDGRWELVEMGILHFTHQEPIDEILES